LFKTHSNNILLPENKQKSEGIGQLVEQITKIQKGNAFWDKDVSKGSTIYPVLVIGDSKLLPDGLSCLMQNWYKDCCSLEGVRVDIARPLIVLSISTLLLYSHEFKNKGFEYYFEEYYKSIEKAKNVPSENMLLNSVNACISFSEYMQKVHPKDFVDTYNSYKDKIFSTEPLLY
jgi:hypothetical protein